MKSGMQFAVVAMALSFAGCATQKPYQFTPELNNQSGEMKKIGVVFDVHIYASNGEDADRSAQSRKIFEDTSVRELVNKGYAVSVLPLDDDLRTLSTQYQNTRGSIARPFSDTKGEVKDLMPLAGMPPVLAKTDVDGIVFVDGVESDPSRASVIGGLALGALTGFFSVPTVTSYADIAVLDKSGKIVFYDRRFGQNYNFSDDVIVSNVLSDFANDLATAQQHVRTP